MRISTKGRYALRVMVDLALHNSGDFNPLKDVSKRQDISVKYLEQIIPLLSKAGYLQSSRGSSGGYKLAKPPQDYTAYDILNTTEGSLAPISCLEGDENSCQFKARCKKLPFWDGLNQVIIDYLKSVTLDELARQEMDTDTVDYYI